MTHHGNRFIPSAFRPWLPETTLGVIGIGVQVLILLAVLLFL